MSKLKILAGVIIALAYIYRKLISNVVEMIALLAAVSGIIGIVLFAVTRSP